MTLKQAKANLLKLAKEDVKQAILDKGFKVSDVASKDITIAALCILEATGREAVKYMKRLKS